MPYTSPATVVTGTTITSAWGNSVKAGEDFLANPPACRVYNNAGLSIPNNTETLLTFNSERFDTNTMHDTVTNPGRITFNTAGLYIVTAHVDWASNAVGDRRTLFKLNGTTYIAWVENMPNNAGASTSQVLTTLYKFVAGDWVAAYGHQTSGGALNVNSTANYSPEFSAVWVGLG